MNEKTKKTNIKVRYGPSPTGIPHIGNLRTALFNYLFAKSSGGQFFLRIEDTDQAREQKGATEKIQQSLKVLNLNWDSEVVFQSKRLDIYQKHLDLLKKSRRVYQDNGAWRFKIDTTQKLMSWEDVVHGKVEFPTNVLEDFIVVKSDKFPTYHFASVVDDHLMEISHVLRGDEWISSTPKHLQLYQALDWQPPKFAHLPPIMRSKNKKLSKREGAKSVFEYLSDGYLPEALVNFLSLLGWSPKGEQEIFSLEELVKEFTLERINKNSPIFNQQKLDWFNSQWIRKLPNDMLISAISSLNSGFEEAQIKKLLPLVKDRMNKLTEFKDIAGFFFKKPTNTSNHGQISVKANVFEKLIEKLEASDDWSEQNIANIVNNLMASENLTKPQLYRGIGVAISGQLVTPPIFPSMEALGKNEVLSRLKSVKLPK